MKRPVPDEPGETKAALEAAPAAGFAKITAYAPHAAALVNDWAMIRTPVGTYGTDYLKRAFIADFGLGANVVEDAIYPSAMVDAHGKPLFIKRQPIRAAFRKG